MIFYEKINFLSVIYLSFSKKEAFYQKSSRLARLALKVLGPKGQTINLMTIGQLYFATGLRKNAFEYSNNKLKELENLDLVESLLSGLKINKSLICEKYLFEYFFRKSEYHEMCKQYIKEHPKLGYKFIFDRANNSSQLLRILKLILFAIKVLDGLGILFVYYLKGLGKKYYLKDAKYVCIANDSLTFQMFDSIFSEKKGVVFCTENPSIFIKSALKMGIDFKNFIYLIRFWCSFSIIFAINIFKYPDEIRGELIGLYSSIVKAFLITPIGSFDYLIVYEHLTIVRAIRNEILKSKNIKTVLITKNTYVTYKHFADERIMNYDLIFSTGKQMEDLIFTRKNDYKNNFVRSACFDLQLYSDNYKRNWLIKADLDNPKKKLRILFLSTGLSDSTFTNEEKLINLAIKLSKEPNLEVLIRLKDQSFDKKYLSFYDKKLANNNINFTDSESNIFDLANNADLFIAGISTSGFDLLSAKCQVYFIDFWGTPDFYLPWEIFPGILLAEDYAHQKIIEWILIPKVREDHAELIRSVSEYISFPAVGLFEYKKNIFAGLNY